MAAVIETHNSNVCQAPKLKVKVSVVAIPLLWFRRFRSRRHLIDLQGQSEHILKDVGLQRGDIQRETLKWFWMP